MGKIEMLDIENSQGVPFRVVYIPAGVSCPHCADSYCDGENRVEFYDRRYDLTPNGQFISAYFASTIVNKPVGGIDLAGGVADWKIDTRAMFHVWSWVMNLTGSWPGCEVKS